MLEKEQEWLEVRKARLLDLIRLAASLYDRYGLTPNLALRTAQEHLGIACSEPLPNAEWWLMEIGLRNFTEARAGLESTDQEPPRAWEKSDRWL